MLNNRRLEFWGLELFIVKWNEWYPDNPDNLTYAPETDMLAIQWELICEKKGIPGIVVVNTERRGIEEKAPTVPLAV